MAIRYALQYPLFQAITSEGLPAAGWKLYHYYPGTEDTKPLYNDPTAKGADHQLAQPVPLDARGECKIFGEGYYKLVLRDDAEAVSDNGEQGNLIWTADYVGKEEISDYWRTVLSKSTAAESVTALGIDNHTHVFNEVPAETVSGSRRNFSTVYKYQAVSLAVYLNGVRQQRTTQYTEDSDRRGYTFVVAPRKSSVVFADYIKDS